MTTLYLVRHGITQANLDRLYCGSTDIGLVENQPFPYNASVPICDVYCTSGMRRCDETLELLCGKVPFKVCNALRETDFGTFEMRSYEMLKADPRYIAWITDQTGNVAPPNGESRNVFQVRVLQGIQEILSDPAERIFIVTHGGVIALLMQHFFPTEIKGFYDWQPKGLCGWRIDFQDHIPIHYTPFPKGR